MHNADSFWRGNIIRYNKMGSLSTPPTSLGCSVLLKANHIDPKEENVSLWDYHVGMCNGQFVMTASPGISTPGR